MLIMRCVLADRFYDMVGTMDEVVRIMAEGGGERTRTRDMLSVCYTN